MRRIEEKPGKREKRAPLGEAKLSEEKGTVAEETMLRQGLCCQTERGGKAFWDAEQLDRDLASRWIPRIASEPFRPRKASVRPLRAGKDHICLTWRSDGGGWQAHLDALMSPELPTGAPVLSAVPVPPEQRCGTSRERVQQNTDPTGLRGRFPMPLALLAQRAAATIANAGTVEYAQTAVSFAALLAGAQRLACWTGQRPIGLESEILPGETTRFPGQGDRRFAIALHRCLLWRGLGDRRDGGSKLRRAQGSWRELMPQIQPAVPDACLTCSLMNTPARLAKQNWASAQTCRIIAALSAPI